jgi:hypothetical protein
MALEVLRSIVPLPGLRVVLEWGEDGGERSSSLEVRLDVVDVDEHAVDDI